jgi:putative peptide zinc metalloprotease protein
MIAYTLVIILLKTAHELGHAYVAKNYGIRVPTMGLAFMVFFPVAYSDVTDAWRLRQRDKRLNIALAGVKVELVLGALSLGLWGVTQPGILNSIFFLLSSTTLISTLLVNLNPAMRYDGYYILSDLWGIDNLSEQCSNYLRWLLRRTILGIETESPVKHASRSRRIKMVIYSIYSWHYRFFLYIGIAVIVYHKFTKPLGVALFILEITLFILRPVYVEIRMLSQERHRIKLNKRILVSSIVLFLALLWLCLPLPRISKAPAVYLPQKSQILYTKKSGRIEKIFKKRGDTVKKGETLIIMESSKLKNDIDYLAVTLKQLSHTIRAFSENLERVGMIPEIRKQRAAAEEEYFGLIEQKNLLMIKADISGILTDMDDEISQGCYVSENQRLGIISSFSDTKIDAFVSEEDVEFLEPGKEVLFYPDDHSRKIRGTIVRVNPIREDTVDILDIGSAAASELPLVKDPQTDRLAFVGSYFKVVIKPDIPPDNTLRLGTSGILRYYTDTRSLAWDFVQHAYSIFIRESGF